MEKRKLYKVLEKGMLSPFQGFKFEIGKEYHCEDFDKDKEKECSGGFYATEVEGLPFAFRLGREVYRCEIWGKQVELDPFKRRYENIRLLELVPYEEVKQLALAKEKKVGYRLSEVLFPINPFSLKKRKPTKKDIELLKEWASIGVPVWDSVGVSIRASVGASIRDSVWNSVWASVGASVRTSVGASIRDSVGATIWASIGDSVGVYIGSLFPGIKEWKGIDHKEGVYPFQSAVDLWKKGLVPSYDGKVWRLHSGEKAEIVWEGKVE